MCQLLKRRMAIGFFQLSNHMHPNLEETAVAPSCVSLQCVQTEGTIHAVYMESMVDTRASFISIVTFSLHPLSLYNSFSHLSSSFPSS